MHIRRKTVSVEQEQRSYSIGEVSRIVNLSQKTLREYEKMGLIKPLRDQNTNNRIYSDFELDQIRHISRLIHNEGFTLPCIRLFLRMAPCWNIFDCEARESCNAYMHPHNPCYEVRKEFGTLCLDSCERCAIYINRSEETKRLLKRPD